jgi:hypothetical protein
VAAALSDCEPWGSALRAAVGEKVGLMVKVSVARALEEAEALASVPEGV